MAGNIEPHYPILYSNMESVSCCFYSNISKIAINQGSFFNALVEITNRQVIVLESGGISAIKLASYLRTFLPTPGLVKGKCLFAHYKRICLIVTGWLLGQMQWWAMYYKAC